MTKKISLWKRLGLLLLVSLVLNSLVQMLIDLPLVISMFGANTPYGWHLLLRMLLKIAMLTPVTALIPGLLMLFGRGFTAWASLPMCILLLLLGLAPIQLGTFLIGYWICAVLARLCWLKARDFYYYLRANG